MKENENIKGQCPICGNRILEGDKLFACESSCGFKVFKNVAQAELTVEDLNKLINGEETDIKTMVSSKGNKFNARLKLKPSLTELEFVFETGNSNDKKIGTCPSCGSDVVVTDGKFGKYYRCHKCTFKIGGKIAGKAITEAQASQLLTDKKTKLIKGFTSNKGSKFDAKLKLDKDNKVTFEFENDK